jgi:hypothetical protein
LCNLTHNHPAFPVLLEQLVYKSAQFFSNNQPVPGVIGDGLYVDYNGNFHKKVEFQGSREEISVSLKMEIATEEQHISGSPFSIPDRVRDQGLDSVFGESNHQKRRRSLYMPGVHHKRLWLV